MRILYKNNKMGFTLVEVLVSFFILAIGMLALAKLQVESLQREVFSKQFAEAGSLAKIKIEELRYFDALPAGSGSFAYGDIVSGTDSQTVGGVVYARTWTVSENTSLKYKVVDIAVVWVGSDGRSNRVNLNTIIAEIDPAAIGGLSGGGSVTP